MSLLPQTLQPDEPIDDKAMQLSTSSSECGEENKGFLYVYGTLPNSPQSTKSQSEQSDPSQIPDRIAQVCYGEVLAELLRNHDVRDSFKTKPVPLGVQATTQPRLRKESADFREIIRRTRNNNRFFLLSEYPEVLLMSREGSCSAFFN